MLHKSLLFFAAFFTFLDASLEDHFKKPFNKGSHSFGSIDFIYMINLDQRPEKFQRCVEQLAPFGIHPYRFSAVNGWELSLEDINDVGLVYEAWMEKGIMGSFYPLEGDFRLVHEPICTPGKVYFSHCMGRGPIGIVLSHLSILQDAYDSGYKTIWVMEDDIEVLQDPRKILDLIQQLNCLVGPQHWDVLFTDSDIKDPLGNKVPCFQAARRPDFNPPHPNRYSQRKLINNTFIKTGARYGAHSMILNRSGIEKILFFLKEHKVFLPYDMEYFYPPGIQLYSLAHDLVSNEPGALSDNGRPNYLLKREDL